MFLEIDSPRDDGRPQGLMPGAGMMADVAPPTIPPDICVSPHNEGSTAVCDHSW